MEHSHLIYKTFGGFVALVSASAWAFSSILFRRLGDEVSPLSMNFGKAIIGILYLGAILLITGMEPVNSQAFLFLGVSGLLGIALGDTFYFRALIYLGPRLTILLGMLGPVITVILAVIFLKERLSPLAWLGIFLTIGGVSWVLWDRSPREKIGKNWTAGIKYGLLSILCMSAGIIFAKIGVASISALQATFIRLLWAVIGLALWGCVSRKLKNWVIPFSSIRLLKFILFTVFVAVFGGFWLFLLALKYIDASIATILNSTTPLFILPMAVFILKEKISMRSIIGAIVAVIGVILIFLR
jgi:drug/metabolite transporter (DMT)-like permease